MRHAVNLVRDLPGYGRSHRRDGSRDPLMPGPPRVIEVARMSPDHVSVVVLHRAAHAINYSHPGELANVISAWPEGREILDDPDQPGETRVFPVPRE